MKVLLGIPTFRRPAELRALLASVAAQRLDGVELSVFVADNDPRDGAGEKLVAGLTDYRWPIAAASVSEPGISAARNRILDEARARGSDLVAMIDDDETAAPDWLASLIAAHVQHRTDVVAGPVVYETRDPPAGFATSGAFAAKHFADGPVAMVTGAGNLLLDGAMLARLGWPRFSTDFGRTGGEDKEFFTRLRSAGARFAWAPAAVAFERVPAARLTVAAIVRRAWGIGGSDYRIDRLHGGRAAAWGHLGRSVALLAAAPLLAPILLLPTRRLWLLRRFARAGGRLAAAWGHRHLGYG